MKKFLLLSAVIATSFNTLAYSNNPETGRPYVKAHIGGQKGQSVYMQNQVNLEATSI